MFRGSSEAAWSVLLTLRQTDVPRGNRGLGTGPRLRRCCRRQVVVLVMMMGAAAAVAVDHPSGPAAGSLGSRYLQHL